MKLTPTAWVVVTLIVAAVVTFLAGAHGPAYVVAAVALVILVTTLQSSMLNTPTDLLGRSDPGAHDADEYEQQHGYRD